jgi:ABC-2 type transport system permease protein
VNRALLVHTWRANRTRLAVVCLSLTAWGTLLPIVYDAFGVQFKALFESNIFPASFANLTQLGGGDIFSMSGAVALGFIHPFAVALNLVFVVGFAASCVAGERQRGTLEVLLSRPLSRRSVYITLAAFAAICVALQVAALGLGSWIGATVTGRSDELGVANLPIQWLNVALLFGAFAAIGLAASVSFDRLAPAVGVTLAVVLISYVLDVIGTIWPAASWLLRWSLFDYVDGKANLTGSPHWNEMGVLAAVIAAAVGYALVVFPRRDLAAPS